MEEDRGVSKEKQTMGAGSRDSKTIRKNWHQHSGCRLHDSLNLFPFGILIEEIKDGFNDFGDDYGIGAHIICGFGKG